MEIKNTLFLTSIIVLFSSCLKEELPVKAPKPGSVQSAQISMMSDYRFQVYFDLGTGLNVAQNLKKDWDIAFECAPDGWHVVLNSSKLMYAAQTKSTDFSAITDTALNYSWKTDAPSGNPDSTAIGNWQKNHFIYLINRGFDEKGKPQGIEKILIESVDQSSFVIHFSNLSETSSKTRTINKIDDLSFLCFSFENGGEVRELEPPKKDWDIVFTQYTEMLYDGVKNIPYLVTGAQINRYQTAAAMTTDMAFEDILLDNIKDLSFSQRINQPGYHWKSYNFDEASYIVDINLIYIIQCSDGLFYKLRFTDFYDEGGSVGHPSFEYQKL
jgi:hypothetical protein